MPCPRGGLFLETANAELDEEYVRFHVGMIPGDYVLFSISDTGIGMSKEVKEQIFDPFFYHQRERQGEPAGVINCLWDREKEGGIFMFTVK